MVIEIELKDSNGKDLNIGDKVDVHNWSRDDKSKLFTGEVVFDEEYMQLTIEAEHGYFDIDQFDLWHKAPKYKVENQD